jgi:hypothetical protein
MLKVTAKQLPFSEEKVLFSTTSWTTVASRLERLAGHFSDNGYHHYKIYLDGELACVDDIPVKGMLPEHLETVRVCLTTTGRAGKTRARCDRQY